MHAELSRFMALSQEYRSGESHAHIGFFPRVAYQEKCVRVLPRTLHRREPDSNYRSRSCERLFWVLPIGEGGTKGGATYKFRSETAMLAWSGCPQPFPSRRDREFESVFLQRRVSGELRSEL
jgi:hypothetical protein